MERLSVLNYRLSEKYGKHDNGKPHYRIAFTTDQMEWRNGIFWEVDTATGIFIRETKGWKFVPKYTIPAQKDRWVLEKLVLDRIPQDMIGLTEDCLYEPLYVFTKVSAEEAARLTAKEKRRLKPILPPWRAIEFVMHCALHNKAKTVADYEAEEAQELKQEVEELYDFLDSESPYLANRLSQGSAIVVPGALK